NQTTMLARESLAIADEIGAAIEQARGAEARATEFRSFDTICSATQERQDAVRELLDTSVDLMVVIGGFNSSNTISLAALCAERVPTYHIESVQAIDPDAHSIHFRRDRCGSASRRARARRTTRSAKWWRAFSPREASRRRSSPAAHGRSTLQTLLRPRRLAVDRPLSRARRR